MRRKLGHSNHISAALNASTLSTKTHFSRPPSSEDKRTSKEGFNLDAVVVFIDDDDPVLGVAADARRSVELSGKTSGGAEVEQEDPV